MYLISTVLVALLSLRSSSAGATNTVIETCKIAGQKKISLCSAIGFSRHENVYNSIFQGLNDDVIVVREGSGNSDMTVLMIKNIELRGDVGEIIGNIQNIIEEAIQKKRTVKLIVILTGKEENNFEKNRITDIIEEAWNLLPKTQVLEGKKLTDYLEMQVYGTQISDEQSLSEVVSTVRAAIEDNSRNNEALMTGSQMMALMSKNQKKEIVRSDEEERSVYECSMIAEDFLTDLRQRLSTSVYLVNQGTSEVLATAVSGALKANYAKHANAYKTHSQSDALKAASYRARIGLASILQPFYRKAIESLRKNSLRAFDMLALRVPPNRRLVSALKAQANAVYTNFKTKSDELKKEYISMFTGDMSTVDPDIENGKLKTPVIEEEETVEASSSPQEDNILRGGSWVDSSKSMDHTMSVGGELNTLRIDLAEACAEREKFLFFQGAYNPFIRDMPIPPTKLSFAYLLDPRGMAYARGYDVMYDEQVDGPTGNRANPLIIPGLASIPFDPNEHPVPTDNQPWWQNIIDFYKGDLNA